MSDPMIDNEFLHGMQEPDTEPDCSDELMVIDVRGTLTPAAMIERKLGNLLKNGSLPVSHLRVSRQRIRAR